MLGGALGTILARGYVNAAMSMLLSMLGVAGMMVLMEAYFPAFIMVSVYAGAVLVLFVFVVMLMGEEKDGRKHHKKARTRCALGFARGVYRLGLAGIPRQIGSAC